MSKARSRLAQQLRGANLMSPYQNRDKALKAFTDLETELVTLLSNEGGDVSPTIDWVADKILLDPKLQRMLALVCQNQSVLNENETSWLNSQLCEIFADVPMSTAPEEKMPLDEMDDLSKAFLEFEETEEPQRFVPVFLLYRFEQDDSEDFVYSKTMKWVSKNIRNSCYLTGTALVLLGAGIEEAKYFTRIRTLQPGAKRASGFRSELQELFYYYHGDPDKKYDQYMAEDLLQFLITTNKNQLMEWAQNGVQAYNMKINEARQRVFISRDKLSSIKQDFIKKLETLKDRIDQKFNRIRQKVSLVCNDMSEIPKDDNGGGWRIQLKTPESKAFPLDVNEAIRNGDLEPRTACDIPEDETYSDWKKTCIDQKLGEGTLKCETWKYNCGEKNEPHNDPCRNQNPNTRTALSKEINYYQMEQGETLGTLDGVVSVTTNPFAEMQFGNPAALPGFALSDTSNEIEVNILDPYGNFVGTKKAILTTTVFKNAANYSYGHYVTKIRNNKKGKIYFVDDLEVYRDYHPDSMLTV